MHLGFSAGCAPRELPIEAIDAGTRSDARATADGAFPEGSVVCNGTLCDDDDPCTVEECVDRTRCVHLNAPTLCRCAPGCVAHASGADGGPFILEDASADGAPSSSAIIPAPGGGLTTEASLTDEDYLWVPNTGESTLSKWSARNRVELARYRVGLASGECRGRCCWENNCNMPSRTVVDGRGDAYVASRGFMMQGTVTKVAAERRDCLDRNGNGMIDTSTGPTNVLPYGDDECVLWTAPVGSVGATLRSLAIDRGDEDQRDGYVWVGACANPPGAGNQGLWKLDPRTGSVLRAVPFAACAYGAVVTPDGTLWQHSLNRGITPVNPYSGTVGPMVRLPTNLARGCAGGSYGITADLRGRLWLSGTSCADTLGYDPRTQSWTRVNLRPFGATIAGLGVTVAPSGRLWIPAIAMSSTLFSWDGDDFVRNGTLPASAVTQHTLDGLNTSTWRPSALGATRDGALWLAFYNPNSPLLRFDPATRALERISGPNQVYTYTDFTGGVRRLLLGRGVYSETIDTGCPNPTFAELTWDAETPENTALTFSMRTSATRDALDSASIVALAVAPADAPPVDLSDRLRVAGVSAPGRYVRLSVAFTPSATPLGAPVLRALTLAWRCLNGPG